MEDTLYNIQFNHRAKVALDVLSPEEKDSVLQAINRLRVSRIETGLGGNIQRFKTDKPNEQLYLLRVNSIFRIIFKFIIPDRIEILDIVMRDRLELFATHQN